MVFGFSSLSHHHRQRRMLLPPAGITPLGALLLSDDD
jgi:hypothetical protein